LKQALDLYLYECEEDIP